MVTNNITEGKEKSTPRFLTVWLGVLLALVIISCKDNSSGPQQQRRMFTPGPIQAMSGVTFVKLTWSPSLYTEDNDESYTLIVSEDSLFEAEPFLTIETDTAGVTLTDSTLEAHKKYFARVKANTLADSPESHYTESKAFSIQGQQIFLAIYGPEVRATSVKLRFQPTSATNNISSITLQAVEGIMNPQPVGDPITVSLTPQDIQSGSKVIEGLEPNTMYQANIYQERQSGNGEVSVGFDSFTTPPKLVFTTTLNAGGDVNTAIDNSMDGDVIGLKPGTYTLDGSTDINAKSITIASTSGNPADTKVNFEKFELKDTGAGITFKGLNLDGGGNSYFVNLVSSDGNSTPADFKNIIVENSYVHNTSNTILRGDRGDDGAFSIDTVRIDNSLMYDQEIAGYNYLTLDGVAFESIEFTNSTFYNVGRKLIGWTNTLDNQPAPTPRILVDHCTINSFGASGKDALIADAADNAVDIAVQNSIIANTPLPGSSVDGPLIVAEGDAVTVNVTNNNFFNLTNGSGEQIGFPDYATLQVNTYINLGWGANTTDFSLPDESPLRSQSSTGGPIGDPRWIY